MTEKINKNRISLDVTIRSSENIRTTTKIIMFVLEQATKVEGELRYSSTLYLTSALDRMSG